MAADSENTPALRIAPWGLGLAFLCAYLPADRLTELFPHPRYGVQPWSLHAALALAFLVLTGRRWTLLVFPAVVCAWTIGSGTNPRYLSWLLAGAAVAGASAVAGEALRRSTHWPGGAVQPRDIHALLAVALMIAGLWAAADALRQIAAPGMDPAAFPLLAWRLFVADLLGVVVWTPALLQFLVRRPAQPGAPRSAAVLLRDAALFLLVLGALLWLVFGFQPLDEFRMSYLLFLPMIVVAMRHGFPGVALAVPCVQLGLLVALEMIGIRAGTAFEFQLLVLTLAIATLYLGALADERRRAAERIAHDERVLRERSHALDEAQRIASTAELAAALAHDLSQPLSAIGTYARASQLLAAMGDAERPKLVETLQHIASETARAGQYLRRMREFFRTGAMRTDRVSVAGLVESTHAHLRDRLVRADITWHATIEPGLPAVRGDAVQLGAVLGNLVANACDAMSEGVTWRQIQLRATRVPDADPARVRILVQDTGPGVAPQIRDQLFRPLATSKPGGMGLGLALSRSIAERQGGHLWFDAQAQWTTFCLELPCHD